jgi:pimeloyl-ACP methyl ester carboxylesterase
VTLLFIHGAGFSSECFENQLRYFPGSHAPNLPGHFSNGEPAIIDDFADAIEQYVEQQRLQDVIACGHSMGGAVALSVALRGRIPLRGIAVLGAGARLRVAPNILLGLESDFETSVRNLAQLFFADASKERIEWAIRSMLSIGPEQTVRDFRACNAFDVLERLSEIRVQLLALTGEHDIMTPAKYAVTLADRVPRGQARIIAGAGHFVMVERPQETNAALAAFISQDLS